MHFDQGSFLTDEEPFEHEDDAYSEIVQDFFIKLDDDLQQPCYNEDESQQNNLMNHNQNNFSSSKLHDENFTKDIQNPLTGPDYQDQNFFFSSQTSDVNDTGQSESLSSSELGDQNSFFNNQIIENSSSGPPGLCNENFFGPDNPSLKQVNSPNLLYGSNFNNWNTASVVPIGINASYLDQNQFNQNGLCINVLDFRANQKKSSNCNHRSLMDFNKKCLPNLSLQPSFGWECKTSAFSGCQNLASDEFDKYLKLMVLQDQPHQKVNKKLKIIVFEFFQEYLKSSHPKLLEGELRPLSRDDRRSVPLINKRLLMIKDYIYHSFKYNPKETLVPIVEAYNEYVLTKHKRKGVNLAKTNLYQIQKIKL